MSALPSAGVFILFLNIVVVVFSVLGMQFFGGKFHWPDGTVSRVVFDDFYQVCPSAVRVASIPGCLRVALLMPCPERGAHTVTEVCHWDYIS